MKTDLRDFTIAPELRGTHSSRDEIFYPCSDGLPMADNTLQFEYIVSLKQGFDALYSNDPNVFVAGDLLWYPVEGNNKLRMAPDVMIAFGRPKGHRSSYLQWKEDLIPPTFVMEVLSPGNRMGEMLKKAAFYLRYGVREYVIYDPDRGMLSILLRDDEEADWNEVEEPNGWKSTLTGVTFFLSVTALIAVRPDGKKFETYEEVQQRAETERLRAEENLKKYETAEEEIARLMTLLRKAGINPN